KQVHTGGTILEYYALENLVEVFLLERSVERDGVDLPYFIAGVSEFLCEFAVVGQQQHSGSISVESSHWIHTFFRCFRDQVEHGLSLLRIISGRDVIFWFVEEYVHEILREEDFLSIYFNFIFG